MSPAYFLGIDQGTSGSRALILDATGAVRGYGYRPLASLYPQPGRVEQDPHAVARSVQEAITAAVADAGIEPADLTACGIACQRNTEFVWDAATGEPVGNAITWQDRRTAELCQTMIEPFGAAELRYRLGHVPGAFSSALHLAWRLRQEPKVIEAARRGRLRAGFSAEWLLHALGSAHAHAMDSSLVQAMGLYDFREKRTWEAWQQQLGIPTDVLPAAQPTVHDYGSLTVTGPSGATAAVPVMAMIGDQQASLFGFDCRLPGQAECTHGTASFVNICLGPQAGTSEKFNLYVGWEIGDEMTYCLEARTTATGSVLRWLRDEARFLTQYDELDALVGSVPDAGGVVFVPAFSGLYDPYDQPHAQGALLGLAFGITRAHIVRAFLDSLGFQVRDILDAIQRETELSIGQLFLGGGLAQSAAACQIQADLLGIPTARLAFTETTARAAALLAGLGSGHWSTPEQLPRLTADSQLFQPALGAQERTEAAARWRRAVVHSAEFSAA